MARPLRIECAGVLYHVTSRGNERKPIYRDDRAYFYFQGLTPHRRARRLRAQREG